MAKENSVFDKEWVDERDKNNLEGLLEQLNVPAAGITFIRENKRLLQIIAVLLVVAVVSWSLYSSYRKNKIEEAGSALTVALNMEHGQMMEALSAIEQDYSGTDAALWAEIKTAQELVKAAKTEDANIKYKELRSSVSGSSSLKALLIFGIAQTDEALGQYPEAALQYGELKTIEGFQEIGLSGLARIYEIQGESDKALAVYQEHLSFLAGNGAPGTTALIEEKIARLKAQ